ncbi:hypothetical protein [Thaumasiovibrio sp. DFM-14]|uniref:hypothetical protein n=1 Tax=Thaumasiovibrio sp. DFM-14 TaxID=3384792 RepID=UPI00399F1D67
MKKYLFTFITLTVLSACSSYEVPDSPQFSANNRWAIMPMYNYSNTPLAAEKAEQILATLLYAKDIKPLRYPNPRPDNLTSILDESFKQNQAGAWLSGQKVDFVITGSVEEWHYKSGLDGEPAVGITLEVKDALSDEIIWQASGSRAGWGRESVSASGQIVMTELLEGLNIATRDR